MFKRRLFAPKNDNLGSRPWRKVYTTADLPRGLPIVWQRSTLCLHVVFNLRNHEITIEQKCICGVKVLFRFLLSALSLNRQTFHSVYLTKANPLKPFPYHRSPIFFTTEEKLRSKFCNNHLLSTQTFLGSVRLLTQLRLCI